MAACSLRGYIACVVIGLAVANPLKRDEPNPSNSRLCHDVYKGQCVDSLKFQCLGLAVQGICDQHVTTPNTADDRTDYQCCNGPLQRIGFG